MPIDTLKPSARESGKHRGFVIGERLYRAASWSLAARVARGMTLDVSLTAEVRPGEERVPIEEPEMIELSTEARIAWGCAGGAVLAVFIIGLAVIGVGSAVLITGADDDPPPMGYLIGGLVYVGAFALAGALIGALLPLRRTWPGALFVGYVAAAAVGVILSHLVNGDADAMERGVVIALFTLAFGSIGGIQIRRSK